LASFVLWVSSASAGPGVIVAARRGVRSAVGVCQRGLRAGARRRGCVLDEANYAGVVHRRPGWLAIRRPGSGGVGYVWSSTRLAGDPQLGDLAFDLYDG
jgi:hypothetical protein